MIKKDLIDIKINTSIIKFSAKWCRPCKAITPVYSALSDEFKSIKFYEVDVDEVDDISTIYNISSLPTFIVLINGVEKSRLVGADPKKLRELVEKASV
jgi:thioredoxin